MKIIRHTDPAGNITHAALQADGRALAIEGDILGDFRLTDRPAQVVKVLAPIQPFAIVCIGLNYKFHAEETKAPIPQHPVVFMKLPNVIQHPGEPILLPTHLKSGKAARNVKRENALQHVLGYTCANDVSARDWQKHAGGGQWCRGKTFDTFCPLGPVLVTADEIPNPNALSIKTVLNGQVMQDWNTNDMIFDVATLIEFLSGSTTLMPGTVILTGTPHGVGMARTPPVFLAAGDTVSVEIEKIGTLTNPVRLEA
jgi:2-keto-4-pentenoate hydratase/2-oxohepta-3-ene-1,7-dioic acid hydratase in catechol pathway